MNADSIDRRSLPAIPLIAGAFFTVAGVMLALDNLDLADSESVLRYWPVVLIVAGLAKFAEREGSRIAATLFVLAGTGLLADNLGLIRFSLFDLWPLILIAVGAAFVAQSLGMKPAAKATESLRGGEFALLSERNVQVTERDYRGGSAAAFMGTLRLDLTAAEIAQSPAVLHTHAMWGSVEVLVPDHWEIVSEGTPFMAAFEVHARGVSDPKRRLIVRGGALMAGVEVKAVSRRMA